MCEGLAQRSKLYAAEYVTVLQNRLATANLHDQM